MSGGVQAGEKVVALGAHLLHEGQVVNLAKEEKMLRIHADAPTEQKKIAQGKRSAALGQRIKNNSRPEGATKFCVLFAKRNSGTIAP